MNDDWTAYPVWVQGRREVALVLTDGATVYLHPDIAKRFAEQITAAVNNTTDSPRADFERNGQDRY